MPCSMSCVVSGAINTQSSSGLIYVTPFCKWITKSSMRISCLRPNWSIKVSMKHYLLHSVNNFLFNFNVKATKKNNITDIIICIVSRIFMRITLIYAFVINLCQHLSLRVIHSLILLVVLCFSPICVCLQCFWLCLLPVHSAFVCFSPFFSGSAVLHCIVTAQTICILSCECHLVWHPIVFLPVSNSASQLYFCPVSAWLQTDWPKKLN